MPNRQRQKGDRAERRVVELLRSVSPRIGAQRVPLSGAAGGEFSGDIRIGLPNGGVYYAEVKARSRAEGWRKIKEWLGCNDILVLVEDRESPLVVMAWDTFEGLLGEYVDASEPRGRPIGDLAPQEDPDPRGEVGRYAPFPDRAASDRYRDDCSRVEARDPETGSLNCE